MSGDHAATSAALDVREARSWLFVPGDRSDRFPKAVASAADIVVYDLEDAVAGDAKDRARVEVARWLNSGGVGCVRINPPGSRWHSADLAAVAGLPGLRAVMVPKAEDPQVLSHLAAVLGSGTAVVALVESALGIHRVHALAGASGVARLALGTIDLALDIGAEDAWLPLLTARASLVLASRVAGLPAPVDGVTQVLSDVSAVEEETRAAASLGYGGKLCVHPLQVPAVHAGFQPSDEELQRARQVVASSAEDGAGRVDGQMVDRPVAERARQVLRRAGVAVAAVDDAGIPTPEEKRT